MRQIPLAMAHLRCKQGAVINGCKLVLILMWRECKQTSRNVHNWELAYHSLTRHDVSSGLFILYLIIIIIYMYYIVLYIMSTQYSTQTYSKLICP